ncbi:F-box domain-containing protein [Seiridium cupressi]
MVEIMRAPSLGGNFAGSMDVMGMTSRFSDVKLAAIDETEAVASHEPRKEPGKDWKATHFRAPRRAFSSNDYHVPSPLSSLPGSVASSPAPRPTEPTSYFSAHITASNTPHSSTPGSPTESPNSPSVNVASADPSRYATAVPHPYSVRPMLPGPQRSYSVMDYVPLPVLQRPGEKLQFIHLPPELHFAVFDFLDDIDSTCLGLASKHFYYIHKRMRGTIPLSTRRAGPNDMEWIWRLAGPLIAKGHSEESAVNSILPRGQVYCRKCGVSRCELHKHIQEWMGDSYEYCDVRQKFGPEAPADAKKNCYRSSPRHPQRCGRHTRQQRTVRLV